jgi:hypothetical protein
MPASRFTKKANTPAKRRQWQHVYAGVKSAGGSAGRAVREANGVLANRLRKRRRIPRK